MRRFRKVELWSRVLRELGIDPGRADFTCSLVEAGQIKRLTGAEPRNMAKMDSSSDRPSIFREHGLFLLPVRNGVYALLRGEGYHRLEWERVEDEGSYRCHMDFRSFLEDMGASEAQHVELAFSSGLLSRVLGRFPLYPSLRGRKYSPPFSFVAGGVRLQVRSVQYEVDACYESEEDVCLFEVKMGRPDDFHVRQLYYPYRSLLHHLRRTRDRRPVRCIFMCCSDEGYTFFEYVFREEECYDSIELVRAGRWRLEPSSSGVGNLFCRGVPRPVENLEDEAPQADDLMKVMETALMAHERGGITHEALAGRFCFTPRQAAYYRKAAELLGLVRYYRVSGLILPRDAAVEMAGLDAPGRAAFLAARILSLPVVSRLKERGARTAAEIGRVLKECYALSPQTALRRAGTLSRWLSWVEHVFQAPALELVHGGGGGGGRRSDG